MSTSRLDALALTLFVTVSAEAACNCFPACREPRRDVEGRMSAATRRGQHAPGPLVRVFRHGNCECGTKAVVLALPPVGRPITRGLPECNFLACGC